jgi:putative transposase
MARLPRFDLAGHLHLVIQRGRDGRPVFVDDEDRRRYLGALLESTREHVVAVHAYALLDDQVLMLATPGAAGALAHAMQALGRRYVKAFNHRHGRGGPLWEGRYRTTVVDAASELLPCLYLVEQAPVRQGLVARATDWPWSSAAHHAGQRRDAIVSEHTGYWVLGNTPFEREARHLRDSRIALDDEVVTRLLSAANHGWPVGSTAFLESLAQASARPLRPRPRGRPAKTVTERQN